MLFRFLILFVSSAFASIQEIPHFSEILNHINADAVVLLDIDETLIAPQQMLGSDMWFDYRLKKYEEEGLSFSKALEAVLAEWEAIRHLSRMQSIEPSTSQIITQLQTQGTRVMGITIQGLALATRTVLQLGELGINLSLTSLCHEDRCLSVQGHTVLYRQGILFTSGKSKGESFFEYCDAIGFHPKKIVAVDDKVSHLQSIEKEALPRGIEFFGLRYAYSDSRKKAFSPVIADYQLTNSRLTYLISDEEAAAAIKDNP